MLRRPGRTPTTPASDAGLGRLARHALRIAALALVSWQVSAAPAPADAYAQRAALHHVVLSPSGKRLAMVVRSDDGAENIAVLDLPAAGPARNVFGLGDADISRLAWVNDDRLILSAYQRTTVLSKDGAGTMAVDHDGGNLLGLAAWRDANWETGTRFKSRLLNYEWDFYAAFNDGSPDVIMRKQTRNAVGEVSHSEIARLNTLTGAIRPLSLGAPPAAVQWVLDKQGELRVVRTFNEGHDRLLLREGESDRWTVIEDHPLYSDRAIAPNRLEGDGTLIVQTNAGGDTSGIYAYDLAKRRLSAEPLVRTDRYDIGSVEWDAKAAQVIGAHLTSDRPMSVWFSARMIGVQKAVDAALPAGRFNRVLCGHCESSPFYVVWSASDQEPGQYFVYDEAKRTLASLGRVRPWIDSATQGTRSFDWIKARDGLPFPVTVTHPAGQPREKALPAVVLAHGGPWVRGASRLWSAEAQFLASRGYRVIEPDFRGSTGYGDRLFAAGMRQWGQAMQDDLADAVAWAVSKGWVDAGRVCIFGGSYGGYAALEGMIHDPTVYRCAASFAGVTDIDLMFTSARGDFSRDVLTYSMPTLIGDPARDAEMLRRASPVQRVAEIKGPVLLAHGTLDRRVPREHANTFEAAARRAGVDIQRVDYNDEAHGWNVAANHADFLGRLDRFLTRSLERPPTAGSPSDKAAAPAGGVAAAASGSEEARGLHD